MNILITAGNTQTPIDRVRCITNIFTGKTGGRIALTAYERKHRVCLLTSHPEVIHELESEHAPAESHWQARAYRTFDDLEGLMAEEIPTGRYDAVIHCAAVSDYQLAGTYAPAEGTAFSGERAVWLAQAGEPRMLDVQRGKVKSHHPELWLRLVPTPKLVDRIRTDWGFGGELVKFKLEVGVSEAELLDIAERSRVQSRADLMCANTLEGMHDWALLGPTAGRYRRLSRRDLAEELIRAVERHVDGR
jgi:phosphopantothenate-cysteine ligase/phosphopantothenoylcysteine decarboxylase/phosphopantothenate--cysteine ligase